MSILSDIRLAVRFLARRPAEPALIAGLFALSIGLASGMWAVVDAVALRPLPYRDGGALVAVLESHPARGLMAVAPANFLDWASRVKTVQDATGLGRLEASITGNGEPIRVIGTRVTERFFDLMGVTPARGRGLNATDFRADGRAAVIGHGIWERQFGRDPAVIGKPLLIDGQAHTVVGVMPREFKTIGKSEIWIPLAQRGSARTPHRTGFRPGADHHRRSGG